MTVLLTSTEAEILEASAGKYGIAHWMLLDSIRQLRGLRMLFDKGLVEIWHKSDRTTIRGVVAHVVATETGIRAIVAYRERVKAKQEEIACRISPQTQTSRALPTRPPRSTATTRTTTRASTR